MQLIDADSVTLDMSMYNSFSVGMPLEERMRIMLERQPTVDAIPVAFIEEKMRKYEELAYQSTPKIQQRYFDKVDALKSLIYYWHEKNEKGDDDATV
jgi:hypothetical protein